MAQKEVSIGSFDACIKIQIFISQAKFNLTESVN